MSIRRKRWWRGWMWLGLALALAACTTRADRLYGEYPQLRYGATANPVDSGTAKPLVGWGPLLEHLLEHAPTLHAAHERYRASVAAVPAATGLPDLKVEYAWLPLPVETRVGPNEHRIMLKQAVPFPTKLVARDSIARADARLAALEYDRAVRDAVTGLKIAYADYHYYGKALEILDANQALAETLAQIGAARNADGSGVLSDVARAQAQLAQLDYDQITLQERHAIARAKLNALLGRTADAPIAVEPLPLQAVAMDEASLVGLGLRHRQELGLLDESIERSTAQLDLAESSWAPDLTIGAQLMLQGESSMTPAPADSGEEALAITFGLSLPIWGWANAARGEAAEAHLIAAIYDKQAEIANLDADVREALFAERNAARLLTLYDEELLPHAIAALETAEAGNRDDASSFADLLEARAAYYSFALARERALADHFQAVARLEQTIGASLTDHSQNTDTPVTDTPVTDTPVTDGGTP